MEVKYWGGGGGCIPPGFAALPIQRAKVRLNKIWQCHDGANSLFTLVSITIRGAADAPKLAF